jgi:hypothetical protein
MDAADLLAFDQLAAETAEDIWTGTVTIGGTDYAATVPEQPPRATLGMGGGMEMEDLVLWIQKANLPVAPARDSFLIHSGRTYHIRSISGGAADACWTLRCEPRN